MPRRDEHGGPKVIGRDEKLRCCVDAVSAPNETLAFEGEYHLVDGRRGDTEVVLNVGFGGQACMDAHMGIDEDEILPCLVVKRGRSPPNFDSPADSSGSPTRDLT